MLRIHAKNSQRIRLRNAGEAGNHRLKAVVQYHIRSGECTPNSLQHEHRPRMRQPLNDSNQKQHLQAHRHILNHK